MGKIKARYVAQLECDFEIEENECELTLDEIHDNVSNKFTPDLKSLLHDSFLLGSGKAKVLISQLYADAWRVEDE